MAERLQPASVAAIERAKVHPGDTVVDVATGTGNAALLAARLGAETVGVDLEPSLLAVAAQRAELAQVYVRWEQADSAALPVEDGWASVIVSIFGVMYSSDQAASAAALARCAAPDARIVLASWVPGSFMPAMGAALSQFLPPPPASTGPPSNWGDPQPLRGLLAAAGIELCSHSVERLGLVFGGVPEAVDFLVRTAGHVVAEKARLFSAGRWSDLLTQLTTLVEETCDSVAGQIRIDLEYLLALSSPAG
jgi:SAM-dependent methyltransferase